MARVAHRDGVPWGGRWLVGAELEQRRISPPPSFLPLPAVKQATVSSLIFFSRNPEEAARRCVPTGACATIAEGPLAAHSHSRTVPMPYTPATSSPPPLPPFFRSPTLCALDTRIAAWQVEKKKKPRNNCYFMFSLYSRVCRRRY